MLKTNFNILGTILKQTIYRYCIQFINTYKLSTLSYNIFEKMLFWREKFHIHILHLNIINNRDNGKKPISKIFSKIGYNSLRLRHDLF